MELNRILAGNQNKYQQARIKNKSKNKISSNYFATDHLETEHPHSEVLVL